MEIIETSCDRCLLSGYPHVTSNFLVGRYAYEKRTLLGKIGPHQLGKIGSLIIAVISIQSAPVEVSQLSFFDQILHKFVTPKSVWVRGLASALILFFS